MNNDKIYLVGFMGAGKSTVARALGERLGWRVEDLDELVESREQMTVTEIFELRGEPYFRAREREVLYTLVPLRYTVVATGGGTFVDPENRGLILSDGTAVWLDLPFDIVVSRVPADGRRPLAASRAQLEELYTMRRAAYQQAHVRLDAGRATTGELVERILDWFGW